MVLISWSSSMKIRIFGAPGSGKTTKALQLAKEYNTPILHIDDVRYRIKYTHKRPKEERHKIIEEFITTHDDWVIEWTALGSYLPYMRQADQVIYQNVNFFICVWRIIRRYSALYTSTTPHTIKGILFLMRYVYDYSSFRKEDIATVSKRPTYRKIT